MENIYKHSIEEDMQMANKSMKRHSTSLILRELKIGTTVREKPLCTQHNC